jgi:hypothetical protein
MVVLPGCSGVVMEGHPWSHLAHVEAVEMKLKYPMKPKH